MSEADLAELQALLDGHRQWWRATNPDPLIDEHEQLDEDSCQWFTSRAEIDVFGLDPDLLFDLHAAYAAFEVFLGIVCAQPEGFGDADRVEELLGKLVALCPPMPVTESIEAPFREAESWPFFFCWFAARFYGLPNRQADAFYHKRQFNTAHLARFPDEPRSHPAHGADQTKTG